MGKPGKVLVLGAGALKIGQSGEFDYSGSQALKALKEEGIFSILVNPNIATIQTSQLLADTVYFLPVTSFFVEKIIEKERPDGILLSFGGQTALNCGLELYHKGILEKFQVQILGTPISAIMLTEDRQAFAEHLNTIHIPTPLSRSAETVDDALQIGAAIGFPVMVRAGFALGGQGSGIAHNEQALAQIVSGALAFAPQVLIEQYLHHFKEIEYEVVRDADDNCITVCNMENMDPLGVHTGESIVVAPSQTLTNHDYYLLRHASIAIVKSLGIVGECNVQFALHPHTSEYYVIEVNARLSRSSALASKATGYPLAYVAAKLALGYALTGLTNKVTGTTQTCFEPSLDYVVVKIPRWDLDKFKHVDHTIGTSMKSVGEVMGIGRSFEEAYQKAIRMLDLGFEGATSTKAFTRDEAGRTDITHHLCTPTPKRFLALALALQAGFFVEEIAEMTGINPWFLHRIQHILDTEQALRATPHLSRQRLLTLKQLGISDKRIGELTGKTEQAIRSLRLKLNLKPVVFQIDTLSAEFPAQTNYLYMTYNGSHHDVDPTGAQGIIILGSGPYRIGSSVEFDWTCVSTVQALKNYQKSSIVINCNPETVSTDYDTSDRLYFEELTFERIADIYEFEAPAGAILSVGGQTPNTLSTALQNYGLPLLGIDASQIEQAEDRYQFSRLLDTLKVQQPAWRNFTTLPEITRFADQVGYPVLVRPSYVLSGSAMNVCADQEELEQYLEKAAAITPEHPITVSKFIRNAREIELDAVAQHGSVKVAVISEHIEHAGVHSGDATIVLPPQTLCEPISAEMKQIGSTIAAALQITGPFNVQFLVKDDQVYVIEANLRASRTFPFISKVTGVNFIELFVDALFQEDLPAVSLPPLPFTAIKAPQFSFSRLSGADPLLRVEMASTGEVACFGEDLEEAYLKAIIATDGRVPHKGVFLRLLGDETKQLFLESAKLLNSLQIPLYATEETYEFLHEQAIAVTRLYNVHEAEEPHVLTSFHQHTIDLVIAIEDEESHQESNDAYILRRSAIDHNIPLFTRLTQARLFIKAIATKDVASLPTKAWNEYMITAVGAH
ncbi:carbamoyl-phosphate synthase (glutamine-hydrolyzing) large subunit [Tengunoibacter tsumagoiensis]|uniref:Carbamoyl phosphate synthase arginine-specific large chain n=1 Tax=Tengunoibacter tsumagoiensis TaxID=2014871 RepID=A0A402A9D9_9CHLR|nr:carbamoyl-phosphate synthase (glutamine-hydrolyzing) large subunit [Tengunoibacter tsumagoiensis]GCE15616.1 carbamoyl-phosphate synthase [Tengunoibacter tsumagoiensis]